MSAENAAEAVTERANAVTMEKLVNLCKRRGLVFPTSDIYGGLGSTFDYGPLGVELKRNVKEAWWRDMALLDSTAQSCSIRAHGRRQVICRISPTRWSIAKAASSVFAPTI